MLTVLSNNYHNCIIRKYINESGLMWKQFPIYQHWIIVSNIQPKYCPIHLSPNPSILWGLGVTNLLWLLNIVLFFQFLTPIFTFIISASNPPEAFAATWAKALYGGGYHLFFHMVRVFDWKIVLCYATFEVIYVQDSSIFLQILTISLFTQKFWRPPKMFGDPPKCFGDPPKMLVYILRRFLKKSHKKEETNTKALRNKKYNPA